MALLITTDHRPGKDILHLQGRLIAESIVEFCRAWNASEGAREIDLAGLSTADEVGIAFLQGLQQAGVPLRNSNPYIAARLQPVA